MSCKCVQVGRWGLAHSLHSCGGQGSNQDFKISFFLFFSTQIHFFVDLAFTQGHHSADLLKFLAQSWKHTIFWNMLVCCAIICSFNGIYLFIHYHILLLSYWSMSDIWLSRAERETSRQYSPHSHQCKIYSIALSMIVICTKNSCADYRLKQMKRLKKEGKGKRKSLMPQWKIMLCPSKEAPCWWRKASEGSQAVTISNLPCTHTFCQSRCFPGNKRL